MTFNPFSPFFARTLSALLLMALLLAGQGARPAYAASYVVTSLLDNNTSGDGQCTLREAIQEANNGADTPDCLGFPSSGDDTIIFLVSGTITLSFPLTIVSGAGALTLDGIGRSITISGGGSVRVMRVNSGADLTLRNLTIANGNAGAGLFGGGVLNDGTLTIANSIFSQNTANDGGGVYNNGAVTITNSTFFANSANNNGGGVANFGMLTITNSAFSGNSATGSGGGVVNSGPATITNSTFSGNSATGSGGGVANSGPATITNSTFSENSAFFGSGGGVYNGGTATLKNTIIANSPSGGDCVGTLSGSNLNNLIESTGANACNLTNTGSNSGNIIGQDPNLGSLTGSPAYFPLLPGSPAIDAGDNATCADPNTVNNQSQNGVTRPQDGNGDGVAVCDIGAFEHLPPAHYVVNTLNDNTTAGDNLCTLREAILAANNDPGYNSNSGCGAASDLDDTITFSVSGTITLTMGTLPNIVSASTAGALTLDGIGRSITISGGGSVRVMRVNSGADLTLRNLTIANGNAGAGLFGGGVLNDGTLTIANSIFSQNTANDGGGVYNNGAVTITNSTFFANSANNNGGGVANFGMLTITNSAFSGNSATGSGGGVANSGPATITNSTFSGNSANRFGGGVSNGGGTLTITNSTFSGNSATLAFGGGGVSNGGTATLKNTIIANSTNGGNCSGTFAAGSTNNMATDATCGPSFTQVTSAQLNLGSLTGSPAYFPLLAGSFAVDAGDNATCADPNTVNNQSQNGVIRPQDGNGDGNAVCDIGSYEAPSTHFIFLPLITK